MANTQDQLAGRSEQWNALYAGDSTLVIEFGNTIDRKLVDQVNRLDSLLLAAVSSGEITGVLETVPTFRSLAIVYDPLIIRPDDLVRAIDKLEAGTGNAITQTQDARHWQLPVLYGTHHGPDLDNVAELTGLSINEVIELHTSSDYSAYMLGFLPGYAFLGDTPRKLHLPRRSEPRLRVPAGSVAIAKQLTGVYPWECPGGWHIIGNCPVPMFDAKQSPPALLKAGDRISFVSINQANYDALVEELQHASIDRSRWAFAE